MKITSKGAVLHLQVELNKSCGVTRTILRIMKNSDNYEHYVITLGGDSLDRFKGYNYKVITADRNSIAGTIKIFFTILDYIKQNNIQIVHSHHRYFDLLAFILKRFSPVKTVTHVQSKVYKKKFLSYKSDKVVAVSNAIKLHLIKNFNVDPSKIFLINNFVDKNEIQISKEKEVILSEVGLKPGAPLLGYFGRLDIKEKGVDILLEALEKVVDIFPSVFLILVGNGIDEKQLQETVVKKKLPALFLGKLENIWNYLNACDVIILPSRVEPFGIVMIEAGLMSKPFIGSNVDGISDTIEDQLTGILFRPGNADDLKDKIIQLLKDKSLMNKIGNNFNREVLNNFTSDTMIPLIEELYNGLLHE